MILYFKYILFVYVNFALPIHFTDFCTCSFICLLTSSSVALRLWTRIFFQVVAGFVSNIWPDWCLSTCCRSKLTMKGTNLRRACECVKWFRHWGRQRTERRSRQSNVMWRIFANMSVGGEEICAQRPSSLRFFDLRDELFRRNYCGLS